MSTEIKKIVIRMGKTDVSLTLEEARELREALKSIFPDPVPSCPIIIEREPWWPYRYWHPVHYTSTTTLSTGQAIAGNFTTDTLYLCKSEG